MLAVVSESNVELIASSDGSFFHPVLQTKISVRSAELLWKKFLFCKGLGR